MAADAEDTPERPCREAKRSAPSYQTLEAGPAPRPAPPGSGAPRHPSRGCRLPGRPETAYSGSVNVPTTRPAPNIQALSRTCRPPTRPLPGPKSGRGSERSARPELGVCLEPTASAAPSALAPPGACVTRRARTASLAAPACCSCDFAPPHAGTTFPGASKEI